MKKISFKLLVIAILLGIGLSSCNDENNKVSDSRELIVKDSPLVDDALITFLEIHFDCEKRGTWPHTYCSTRPDKTCFLWFSLGRPHSEVINTNDYRWPSSLVEQQGSGVYSIPENCPTSNTLRLRVNYYFATEDTGLSECRQIASSGLWTINENLVFESDEIAGVIESNNTIRVNAGNYTITRVDDYQFIVDLPYQIVE